MSYDLRFAVKADIAGEDRYVEFKYATLSNPTYNIGDMFRACTGWNFEQGEFYKCSDVIDKVKHGAQELRNHASKYRKYESPNGWGMINAAIVGNNDFRNLNLKFLKDDDFVYLDPPYFNTIATYTENGGWNEKDENDLYRLCESLNSRGVKFGMSNVFKNKNIVNHKLIDWCDSNDFNVYTFDKISYTACGKGNSNAKEVFITNYRV